jgi:hypothetical protein
MCDKVCKDISMYLQKYKKENPNTTDLMLVIQVREVIESANSLMPKLEYKNE